MSDRTLEAILADWRGAEAELAAANAEGRADHGLLDRFEHLRAEYSSAVAERHVEAHELGSAPSATLDLAH